MIRINLLPPEIVAKRKSEGRWLWVGLVFALVLVLLVSFWGFNRMTVGAAENEVARLEQEALELEQEAESFAIFEQNQADLDQRKATVATALDGMVDWTRLCQEFSLVLPGDMWLGLLTGDQEAGLSLAGSALDPFDDVPDQGHKTIAVLLVRLADLEQLQNVWLATSTKAGGFVDEEGGFQPGTVDFQVTAELSDQATLESTAETVTAPPEDS